MLLPRPWMQVRCDQILRDQIVCDENGLFHRFESLCRLTSRDSDATKVFVRGDVQDAGNAFYLKLLASTRQRRAPLCARVSRD
jgi:hypothetical protein